MEWTSMILGHISKVVIKKENEMVNRCGFFLEIFSEASSYVRVSFRRFKGCLFNVFNRFCAEIDSWPCNSTRASFLVVPLTFGAG
jgi:hypothetical protein